MSQKQGASNKTPLIVMSVVGLLVVSALAYFLTRPPKSPMVTELYKYYPDNTAFFVELSPGDKLSSRFFSGMDKLRAMHKDSPQQDNMQLSQLFQKDFEPQFSAGTWKADPKSESDTLPFLMVIPTKKGVSMDTLTQDLHLPANSYSIQKEGDATFLQSKSAHTPILALHQNHLLVSNDAAILKTALEDYKTPSSLLDNPLYKNNLKLLPTERQGTVLALTEEFRDLSQQAPSPAKNPTLDNLSELQQKLQAATPVMVASVKVDKDQFIHFDSFTPVDLAKVEDTAFRKDIQSLYSHQATFQLSQILPQNTVLYGGMVGLADYYDLYINHIATKEDKTSIESFENQLKMMGLDLRKNLISLLDGKSAIGVTASTGQPNILLFLNSTPDTQKAIDQFGMMAAQMTGGKMNDKQVEGDHTLKVLESPMMPIKVAYSNVDTGTLAFGTQAGLEEVYAIEQKKSPSLNENKLYKELSASMPSKVNGLFFINLQEGAALVDELAKKSPASAASRKNQVKELFSGIEGVAGSNTLDPSNVLKGHVTVKLTPQS